MALFDGKLKQRLIGALVLIVLAVVFLPMIFNNKGDKIPETVVTVPPEPIKPDTPVNQATHLPPATVQPSVAQQPVITTTDTTIPSTPPSTSQPVVTTPVTPPTDRPVVAKPDANGLTATWTIQVAAVTNLANAESFRDRLRKANYNAYVRSEGNVHRVFVGPFIEKAVATKTQQQIQKQFNEKGIIREFIPERK